MNPMSRGFIAAAIAAALTLLPGCSTVSVDVGADIEAGGGHGKHGGEGGHHRRGDGGGGGLGLGLELSIPIGNTTDEAKEEPKICGPDITGKVMAVLDLMMTEYNSPNRTAEQRKAACEALITPDLIDGTHEVAWDITELSPGVAPKKEDSEEWRRGRHYWFEPYAAACCTPREPCGASVVFLGRCMHAQVVNYIQWGVTNKLCDQMGPARAMHLARAKASHGLSGLFSVERDPVYMDQSIMTDLGERFVELRREGKSLTEIVEVLEPESVDLDIMSSRPQSECAMTCTLTEREQKRFDLMEFSYVWEKLLPARARVKNRTGY